MSPTVITLIFLAFAIIMFVTEKIPLGLTSMIVCIGLVILAPVYAYFFATPEYVYFYAGLASLSSSWFGDIMNWLMPVSRDICRIRRC